MNYKNQNLFLPFPVKNSDSKFSLGIGVIIRLMSDKNQNLDCPTAMYITRIILRLIEYKN